MGKGIISRTMQFLPRKKSANVRATILTTPFLSELEFSEFGRIHAALGRFGVVNAGELAGSSFSQLGAAFLRVQAPGAQPSVWLLT